MRLVRGVVCTTLALLIAVSQWHVLSEPNPCEMSYSSPRYLEVERDSSHYRLLRFVHGPSPATTTGQPVLFIPGHMGSFKQVRSIAAASVPRPAGAPEAPVLDFFTLDFAEEPTALSHALFAAQCAFTRAAILAIQRQYPAPAPAVILLAHSMGGPIALDALTRNATADSVDSVLAIASPLSRPPVAWEADTMFAYMTWRRALTRRSFAPVLSVATGVRDWYVSDEATEPPAGVWVHTSAMPCVAFSVDHLASVWCKQLVLRVRDALERLATGTTTPSGAAAEFQAEGASPSGRSDLAPSSLADRVRAAKDALMLAPANDVPRVSSDPPTPTPFARRLRSARDFLASLVSRTSDLLVPCLVLAVAHDTLPLTPRVFFTLGLLSLVLMVAGAGHAGTSQPLNLVWFLEGRDALDPRPRSRLMQTSTDRMWSRGVDFLVAFGLAHAVLFVLQGLMALLHRARLCEFCRRTDATIPAEDLVPVASPGEVEAVQSSAATDPTLRTSDAEASTAPEPPTLSRTAPTTITAVIQALPQAIQRSFVAFHLALGVWALLLSRFRPAHKIVWSTTDVSVVFALAGGILRLVGVSRAPTATEAGARLTILLATIPPLASIVLPPILNPETAPTWDAWRAGPRFELGLFVILAALASVAPVHLRADLQMFAASLVAVLAAIAPHVIIPIASLADLLLLVP